MTQEERERMRRLRASADPARVLLLNIQREVRSLSPRQAGVLGRIIHQLEAWQTRRDLR
jgi:hypothetical protein